MKSVSATVLLQLVFCDALLLYACCQKNGKRKQKLPGKKISNFMKIVDSFVSYIPEMKKGPITTH